MAETENKFCQIIKTIATKIINSESPVLYCIGLCIFVCGYLAKEMNNTNMIHIRICD